jgi:hypothetical protein
MEGLRKSVNNPSQDVDLRTVFWNWEAHNTKQECCLPILPGISVLNMKIGQLLVNNIFSNFGRWPCILTAYICNCFDKLFSPSRETVHIMIVSVKLPLVTSCSIWYIGARTSRYTYQQFSCTEVDRTPALYLAGPVFCLSSQTGYLNWGFSSISPGECR